MIGIADARQHQKLRRVDHTAAQDDFAIGRGELAAATLKILNTSCPAIFAGDTRDVRIHLYGQVGA